MGQGPHRRRPRPGPRLHPARASGPYQLQAGIRAVHCDAASFESTDWSQTATIYDQLYAMAPTPVVALNRAIAIAEVDGPAAALDLIDQVANELDHYHLMHAARATYLEPRTISS